MVYVLMMLATLLTVVAMLAGLGALVGLIPLSRLKLTSRFHAVGLIISFFALFGLVLLIAPEAEVTAEDASNNRMAGAILIVGWVFMFYLLDVIAKKVRNLRKAPAAPSGDAKAAREAVAEQKRCDDEYRAKFDQKFLEDEEKGASGRLEEKFDDYRAGLLTLDEYRQAILEEQGDNRKRLKTLREDRPHYAADEYEDEKERLDEDREEIRWRLEWVNDRLSQQADAAEFGGQSGEWARFEYSDADGVVTKRDIARWEIRGRYIVGYDRKKKEERTFRQDRISEWISG